MAIDAKKTKKWPIQIDPYECGCTECLIGMYVPLEMATYKQLKKMLKGKINDATSNEFEFKDGWINSKWHGLSWHKDGMRYQDMRAG